MGKFEHFCQDFSTKRCEKKHKSFFEGNNIISDQYEEEEETSLNICYYCL